MRTNQHDSIVNKRNGYSINLSKWFYLPSEKGSTPNGKDFLPRGENSFLLE